MTTHELANILLQQEDVSVHFQYFDGGIDQCYEPVVASVHTYNGEVYLSRNDKFFPPELEIEDWEEEVQDNKTLVWSDLLLHVSEEAQNAFISFISVDNRHHRMNLELIQPHLERCLWSYYHSNARLTQEYMREFITAMQVLGFTPDQKFVEAIDETEIQHYTRYNTEREQIAAIRNNRK